MPKWETWTKKPETPQASPWQNCVNPRLFLFFKEPAPSRLSNKVCGGPETALANPGSTARGSKRFSGPFSGPINPAGTHFGPRGRKWPPAGSIFWGKNEKRAAAMKRGSFSAGWAMAERTRLVGFPVRRGGEVPSVAGDWGKWVALAADRGLKAGRAPRCGAGPVHTGGYDVVAGVLARVPRPHGPFFFFLRFAGGGGLARSLESDAGQLAARHLWKSFGRKGGWRRQTDQNLPKAGQSHAIVTDGREPVFSVELPARGDGAETPEQKRTFCCDRSGGANFPFGPPRAGLIGEPRKWGAEDDLRRPRQWPDCACNYLCPLYQLGKISEPVGRRFSRFGSCASIHCAQKPRFHAGSG